MTRAGWCTIAVVAAAACAPAQAHDRSPRGYANPHPVHLRRPADLPLSAVAQLGRALFFDRSLSASGAVACASCHDPAHAYGPDGATPAHLAGANVPAQSIRAVPSLRYLRPTGNFSIGPDDGAENVDLSQLAAQAKSIPRQVKIAGSTAPPVMVPQGGLFWDGRVNTLENQAMGPLFNPDEMANRSRAAVSARLRRRYGATLATLFGPAVLADSIRLLDEAMFAVARYETEDASFHPYSSTYDAYLEGHATLTAEEWRGLQAFDDPRRGNCAGCHIDRPAPDGTPPRFTDDQYEALAVPRNHALPANAQRRYYDLGVCGPVRTDLSQQTQYCGMFHTPSLRNSATRTTLFHNGVYTNLASVLRFYDLRDVWPDAIYGAGRRDDDVPASFRGNVDTVDAPFGRRRRPAMSAQDMRDITAFLATLTDQSGR